MSYISEKNIIIALKDNDVILPPDRGFPFQVVATGKFGYKWAKWVTRIELSSDTSFRGYWESRGYNNARMSTGLHSRRDNSRGDRRLNGEVDTSLGRRIFRRPLTLAPMAGSIVLWKMIGAWL